MFSNWIVIPYYNIFSLSGVRLSRKQKNYILTPNREKVKQNLKETYFFTRAYGLIADDKQRKKKIPSIKHNFVLYLSNRSSNIDGNRKIQEISRAIFRFIGMTFV